MTHSVPLLLPAAASRQSCWDNHGTHQLQGCSAGWMTPQKATPASTASPSINIYVSVSAHSSSEELTASCQPSFCKPEKFNYQNKAYRQTLWDANYQDYYGNNREWMMTSRSRQHMHLVGTANCLTLLTDAHWHHNIFFTKYLTIWIVLPPATINIFCIYSLNKSPLIFPVEVPKHIFNLYLMRQCELSKWVLIN